MRNVLLALLASLVIACGCPREDFVSTEYSAAYPVPGPSERCGPGTELQRLFGEPGHFPWNSQGGLCELEVMDEGCASATFTSSCDQLAPPGVNDARYTVELRIVSQEETVEILGRDVGGASDDFLAGDVTLVANGGDCMQTWRDVVFFGRAL